MNDNKRYYSPSRSRDLEIGLDEFTDEEIRGEYAHRNGKALPETLMAPEDEPVQVSAARMREIRALMLAGRHSEATRATDDLIRDTLGTAI